MPLLEIKHLSVSFKTYLGNVRAIRDVSFSVEKGETVAIVGESGCGKSATAAAILDLIPKPPGKIEEGEIFFNGEDLLKKSKQQMRQIRGKEIGMIFQDSMTSLNPTMRIGNQIMESLIMHKGLAKSKARHKAIELLELVGISNPEKRLDQYPYEFSGGMRQRVMISIALACSPSLLIADEPTTALDVTIQAQILNLMKEIQSKMQMSIILITHDLGVVASICDRVIVMYSGQVVENAKVKDLFQSPKHPYTQGLLRSIPRLDMNKAKELIPILGSPLNLQSIPKGCPFLPRCEKAMRICELQNPSLISLHDNHLVACWKERK